MLNVGAKRKFILFVAFRSGVSIRHEVYMLFNPYPANVEYRVSS